MLKLDMGEWTIQQETRNSYKIIDNTNKRTSKEVKVDRENGITCSCKKFYNNKTCRHYKWIFNIRYVINTNPNSLLHAQYSDLLTSRGLGQESQKEDFKILKNSLDIITYENEKSIWGRYFSRDTGVSLLIEIKKVNLEKGGLIFKVS